MNHAASRIVAAAVTFALCSGAAIARAEPYHGLYYYFDKGYTWLAPDGKFLFGKPKWRKNGSFDYAASIAEAPPYRHGSYQVGPAGEDGTRELVMNTKDGQTRKFRLSRGDDGRWHIRRDRGTQITPATISELDGLWTASSSYSAARDHGRLDAGDVEVALEVGTSSKIEFLPGKRFALRDRTWAIASKTHGTTTGNVSGEAKQNADTKEGRGTYRINGMFLTLTFDDGRVVQELFHQVKSASSTKRIVIGGRSYQQR